MLGVLTVTLCLVFVCAVSYTPPTVPFTSAEAAQAWIDSIVQLNADFYNGLCDYAECCSMFDGGDATVDGVAQNPKTRRARYNMVRRKVTAGTAYSSCTLDEDAFSPPTYAIVADCTDQGVINLPVVGDYNFESSSTRSYVFDAEGNIAQHSISSPNAVIGQVLSALITSTTSDNAQNGDADMIVFEFGSLKVDRFDAVLLAAFAIFTSIVGIALCFIMKRVNAMYRYLMPRGRKHVKYDDVASTDNEL